MPGILPMKVIRVGSATQSRIAQACDRCRSKKIRCDGIRPCCTQCQNVGFECKTSDKLSRRAFPRGYTESLEDRVRGLEAEVRELKDLLDEKDEKIDMLSRIHNFSPASRRCSSSLSPTNTTQIKAELESVREEVLLVENSVPTETVSASLGPSSTAAFIAAFEKEARESRREVPIIHTESFNTQSPPPSTSAASQRSTSKIPPRLLSDQYINLFFQEWQPLLPIFHRPTFLRIYEQYLIDPEASYWHSNKYAIAQLYLIFDISAMSSVSRIKQSTTSYEPQWRKALQSNSSTACLQLVQCHVLAQLFYLLKADYSHLARQRAIGISMCHQMGLHQNHKYHSLPALDAETKKRVFWCQYVLDKFASAATGTPMLLHDSDITTESPSDVDDENISAQGFSPALPGELTKISSALALFKAARILSKVIEQLYPAKASYQVSLNKLHAISDELDQWSTNLPPHLKLQFCKDKPSTNLTGCRSPLLSLAYFYIRGLIHRPLVCHGSGSPASASTIVLAAAAKHVLQILDLLDERRMNYTFPMNKAELLLFSGFSVLWQCLDLEEDSKLLKDNQNTLTALTEMLARDTQSAGFEFLRIASTIVTIGGRRQSATLTPKQIDINSTATRLLNSMPAPTTKARSTKKSLQAIASRFPSFTNKQRPEDAAGRRATVPCEGPSLSVSPTLRTYSSASLSSTRSTPVLPTFSPSTARLSLSRTIDIPPDVNLDYFPIGEDITTHSSSTTTLPSKHLSTNNHSLVDLSDPSWEQLLTNIDNGTFSIYNTPNPTSVSPGANMSMSSSQEWMPPPPPALDDSWPTLVDSKAAVPQSVLSFSEESLVSNDDHVFSTAGSHNGSTATNDSSEFTDISSPNGGGFKGIAMPSTSALAEDEFGFGSELE